MVYNSIKYSFADDSTKNDLTSKLDSAFADFEKVYKA